MPVLICRNSAQPLYKTLIAPTRFFYLSTCILTNDKSHTNTSSEFNKEYSAAKEKYSNISNPPAVTPAEPEEPTVCCMSGCANCVWLEYAERLAEYYKDGGKKAEKEINEKISDPSIKAYLLHEIRMRTKKL